MPAGARRRTRRALLAGVRRNPLTPLNSVTEIDFGPAKAEVEAIDTRGRRQLERDAGTVRIAE